MNGEGKFLRPPKSRIGFISNQKMEGHGKIGAGLPRKGERRKKRRKSGGESSEFLEKNARLKDTYAAGMLCGAEGAGERLGGRGG